MSIRSEILNNLEQQQQQFPQLQQQFPQLQQQFPQLQQQFPQLQQQVPSVGFSTLVIHGGQEPEQWGIGPVVPPIVTSTSFKRSRGTRAVSGLRRSNSVSGLNNVSDVYGPSWSGIGENLRWNVNDVTRGGVNNWSPYFSREYENRYENRLGYYGKPSVFQDYQQRQGFGNVYPFIEELALNFDRSLNLPSVQGRLQYPYGRNSNPTRSVLERNLAALENARFALAVSSGNAALTVLASLLKTGDNVVVIEDVYVDTRRFFEDYAVRTGIVPNFVNMDNLSEVSRVITPNTRMVWIETPTNPSLTLVDIPKIVAIVREQVPSAIVVVDNTIATPFYQRPLELGADVVLHSLSKFLNGHMDVIMGALMTNNEQIFRRLRVLQDSLGVSPSPYDSHLVIRGLKTFPIRMREHWNNALKVATALESNPNVQQVIYPGLRSHPQYDLFRRQMKGFGGVIAIKVKGGPQQVEKFLDALRLIACAEGVGGYATLIEQPDRELIERGLQPRYGDNYLRLSVGLEDAEDIINDLFQALNRINVV